MAIKHLASIRADRLRGADEIRVLVISPQLAFAQALGVALGSEDGFHVVAAVAEADGAARALDALPDVVVVDMDDDDAGGLAFVEALAGREPRVRAVAVAARMSAETCGRALRAGASGFASKAASLSEVVQCVRAAARGQAVVPAPLLPFVIAGAAARPAQSQGALTEREAEILGLCAEGLGTRAIAAKLVVSVNTVRTHIQNVLTKLGAHSRLEAVAKARGARLLEAAGVS